MPQAFITGDKTYLRLIEESDLTPEYQNWFNDEQICQFNSHHRFPNYQEDMRSYYDNVIKSKNNLILAIIDKENDKHIGNVSLQDMDFLNQDAELAIIIGDKNFWGKGVGEEVCRLVVEHGFKNLNLHRIHCSIADNNIGMRKLARKLGFNEEGILRQNFYKNGQYRDTVLFGLLKNEYKTT